MPAFEQGMAIQQAEIQAIIDNPAAPTFENTIVALEKSGRMLGRVARVFFALTGSNTTDRLDEINTEISPKLTAHGDSDHAQPRTVRAGESCLRQPRRDEHDARRRQAARGYL